MSDTLNKQIGARVRVQRESLGITREGLCNHVSISPQFLSEIERGIKGVSAETMYKLCEGLGVSADYLLLGRETLTDISPVVARFAMLDEAYIPLAEDLLNTLFQASVVRSRNVDLTE